MFEKKGAAVKDNPSVMQKGENMTSTQPTKGVKTRITVKYDVGFNNTLFIRGKGANLSWEKGIPLKNVKSDEWMWESDLAFPVAEFKILINDRQYELGPNHNIHGGAQIQYTPQF